MKIVVIGATGLVGSASVKELAQRGHEVIAITHSNLDKIEKANNVRGVQADVNHPTPIFSSIWKVQMRW